MRRETANAITIGVLFGVLGVCLALMLSGCHTDNENTTIITMQQVEADTDVDTETYFFHDHNGGKPVFVKRNGKQWCVEE